MASCGYNQAAYGNRAGSVTETYGVPEVKGAVVAGIKSETQRKAKAGVLARAQFCDCERQTECTATAQKRKE